MTRSLCILALLIAGCKDHNSLTGGQARHDTGSLVVSYDGVTIQDSRESRSTTGPSATSSGPGKFKAGPVDEQNTGTLDFSIDQVKGRNFAGSVAVAAMFVGAGLLIGIILWIAGNRIVAIIVGVIAFIGAGLAFLYPWILGLVFVIVLVAALAYVAYIVFKKERHVEKVSEHFKQVVQSVDKAFEKVEAVPLSVPMIPVDSRETRDALVAQSVVKDAKTTMLGEMSAVQDKDTKRAVDDARRA